MAVTVTDADTYISSYVIDNTDWVDSDTARKTRILNVASRELANKFKDLVIPDEAVYEFAAVLAIVFNDTNRLQMQGVAGFSLTGVGSFTFKDNNIKNPSWVALTDLIPQTVYDLVSEANNGIKIGRRIVKDVIL